MNAFERAKYLHHHASHVGAPLEEFVLELTDAEAFDALETLLSMASPGEMNVELFRMDLAIARASGSPWELMNNFKIMGFVVCRRQGELH